MIPFKGRTIDRERVVKVYRNLHAHSPEEKWSIQQDGKVVAHAESLVLSGVEFKVSQKGRQRVLRERVKNVHAFLIGKLSCSDRAEAVASSGGSKVIYNPYHCGTFITYEGGFPVSFSHEVFLTSEGVFVCDYIRGDGALETS